MLRRSDWLVLPPDFVPPDTVRYGLLLSRNRWYLHHSMLPACPISIRNRIRDDDWPPRPRWQHDVDDISTPNLRPYQTEAAEFARERDGSLLALEMGTGKTRTALYAVDHSDPQRGVIVAPKVAFGVWEKELDLVFGDRLPVKRVRGRKMADYAEDVRSEGIYLLNPEILYHRWTEWEGAGLDFAILDEAHYYTKGRAQRSKGAAGLGAMAKQTVALTGTPILRHLLDLHGIMQTIAPKAFGSWQTLAAWLGQHRTAHGWDLVDVPPDRFALFEARLADIMVRKRWTDVSDDVPEIQREAIPVDMTAHDARIYRSYASDVRQVLGDRVNLRTLQNAASLVQATVLRRFVGMQKVPAVLEFLRTLREPAVVWAWHKDVVNAIASESRQTSVILTGDQSEEDRQAAIDLFQSGDADLFVGTMAAGGVGIDLTRARITLFAELDWTPASHSQAEARVFRAGQTQPCLTYWFSATDTIEDHIVEILMRKAIHTQDEIFPSGIESDPGLDPDEEMFGWLEEG